MEEQDRIEAKRAKNFIWSAAQCYDFEPLFLAFSLDGTADIYLNLIIGLCYKWYNREKMEEFFEMLNGKNQETLEGLFWIGLDITDQKKRKVLFRFCQFMSQRKADMGFLVYRRI